MSRRMHSLSLSILAGVVASFVAGCGGKGYDGAQRAEVKGKVTFNGTPIKNGTLNLKPIDKDTGRSAGTPITDGQYVIPELNGPTFGKYRVEIFAFEPMAAKAGGDAEASDQTKQILAAKFNNNSTIELEVNSEIVEKNFDLKP